jgi:hypothetical protein
MFDRVKPWVEKHMKIVLIGNLVGPLTGFFADYGSIKIVPSSPYPEIKNKILLEMENGSIEPLPTELFSKDIDKKIIASVYAKTTQVLSEKIVDAAKSYLSYSLASKVISREERKVRLESFEEFINENLYTTATDQASFESVFAKTNLLFTYTLEGSVVTDEESSLELTTDIFRAATRLNHGEITEEKTTGTI